MKKLLSQAFGFVEEKKIVDKSIKPHFIFTITSNQVKKDFIGYDKRLDNVDFILKEYKKAQEELNQLNKF